MSSKSKQQTATTAAPTAEAQTPTAPAMSNAQVAEAIRARRQSERATELSGRGKLNTDLIEHMDAALKNPTDTKERPRMGIADRQARVMDIASKADPFMRTLAGGGNLDGSHEKTKGLTTDSGRVKSDIGVDDSGTTLRRDGHDVYGYGAAEYGNRPSHQPRNHVNADDTQPDYVERLLPQLTNSPGGTNADGGHGRTGRWSEADVDPLKTRDIGDGGAKKLHRRNADRLLHTAADSETADGQLDHPFYVTADHYESAVPVAPVETNYKQNNPYTAKYDKDGKPT